VGHEHAVKPLASAPQVILDRAQVLVSSLPRIDHHRAAIIPRDEERVVAIAGHRTGIVRVEQDWIEHNGCRRSMVAADFHERKRA
jgi:hypothetical protein